MKKLILSRANFALGFTPELKEPPEPVVEITLTTMEPHAVFSGRTLTTEDRLVECRFTTGIDGLTGLIESLTAHLATLKSLPEIES